jgi:hypothetical protein
MIMQHYNKILTLVICCLFLGCSKNNKPSDGRELWKHSAGVFRWSSGRDWSEQAQDGPHRYREVQRTEEFVELQDKDRPIKVWLYENRSEAEMNGTVRVDLYQGAWDKPAAASGK